jgi:hypothetical protein
MIPETPLPPDSKIRTPVILKLKPQWRFETNRRVFTSQSGEEFKPSGDLPRNTRIVLHTPDLARTPKAALSKHEKDLLRYVQVILPASVRPEDYLETIRGWACVEKAYVAPQVSLP